MPEKFPQGFALLIGVGRCAYRPWSLPTTSRDAEALKLVLTDPRRCGYLDEHIQLLTNQNATKASILSALAELGEAIAEVPEATVVIFFSGHGWLDKHGRYSLLVHDTDPKSFRETALPADDFTEALRLLKPERLLVLLDTCHAGGMGEVKDAGDSGVPHGHWAAPTSLAQSLGAGRGRAVLSSCRGEEKSLVLPDGNLSLFTYYLISALKGAARREAQQSIQVLDLMSYVSRAVAEGAKKLGHVQTPFHKAETEDFAVARLPEEPKQEEKRKASDETEAPFMSSQNQNRAGRDVLNVQSQDIGSFTTGASSNHRASDSSED